MEEITAGPSSTAQEKTGRRLRLAGILVGLSFLLFLCQLLNLNTSHAKANSSELGSLPVSIRANSQADYSADPHTVVPPVSESILDQIIRDIPATGNPQDRMSTLQVALSSPVPTMTPDVRFPATTTPTLLLPTSTGVQASSTSPVTVTPPVTVTRYVSPTPTVTYASSMNHSSQPTATKTAIPSRTSTSTRTQTPTATASPTATMSQTPTTTHTPTNTLTFTPSATATVTMSQTFTMTATATQTSTATDTPTLTATLTHTATLSPTLTHTATLTQTSTPSATPVLSDTPTLTSTFTDTPTFTPSSTTTFTATYTPSPTNTSTPTETLTNTPTATQTSSPSETSSPTATQTPTATPTLTPSSTTTFTATYTPSPTNTSTSTPTPSSSPTFTPTPTIPYTSTFTLTPTETPTLTPSPTLTYTSTATNTPTETPTATQTPSPTFSLTPTATETPTLTPTASPTGTMSPTSTYTPTSTMTLTATVTPSQTPTFTSTPTVTVTPSLTPTPGLPACFAGTPNGLLPSDDTYIRGDQPSNNFGSDNKFEVRPDNGADRRGLVKFDLSSIPANATITSATLYLFEQSSKSGQTTSLHRVTSNWNENSATWQSWGSPGGDFDSSISYYTFIPDQGNCLVTLDVTSLVQLWVNGTYLNHGLMLYSAGPNHTISYTSKEDGTASRQPKLDISYTVPPTQTPTATPTSTYTPTLTPTASPTGTMSPTPMFTPTATLSLPEITISNDSAFEQDSGSTIYQFIVRLSTIPSSTVTFDYATASGSGTGGAACGGSTDFVNKSGTLSIVAPATAANITITVCGDGVSEADEAFSVVLTNPVNAVVSDSGGVGTIFDDDSPGFTGATFVKDITPENGSIGASTNTPIVIEFNRDMCESTVLDPSNTRVYPVLLGSDVAATRVYNPLTRTLVITPLSNLSLLTNYQVQILNTKSLVDNCILSPSPQNESFTTGL